ncbi:MAG: metallophosphoesterase family protein [Planctomycetaceae bacterium]|jgi:hypothetical protein|nr:metallophosphoesterase family protein [Planctomycetaceae bacterium]
MRYLFLLLFTISCTFIFAQEKPMLQFSESGNFRIAQITDTHFNSNHENKETPKERLKMINTVLDTENPDFVIYTGDNVNNNSLQDWDTIFEPCIQRKIPWAFIFGNHDDEYQRSREELMDYVSKLPYCYAEYGPKEIGGVGNYILTVHSRGQSIPSALLYCFDNAYKVPQQPQCLSGPVGWFSSDQIQWYREKSKEYTKKNESKPIPALAFFHIPLDEYVQIPAFPKETKMVGDKGEKECVGILNSGLFQTMFECGDVMGTFCGHDHENDYIGILHGIALAYGRSACQREPYGSRLIEINNSGKRTFKTWIRLSTGTKINEVTVGTP